MPYWCTDCRSYFSVKTGTPMECSRLPLRKWVVAMYLMTTSLKGVSSMKLHRDPGISQKTARFVTESARRGKRMDLSASPGLPRLKRRTWAAGTNTLIDPG